MAQQIFKVESVLEEVHLCKSGRRWTAAAEQNINMRAPLVMHLLFQSFTYLTLSILAFLHKFSWLASTRCQPACRLIHVIVHSQAVCSYCAFSYFPAVLLVRLQRCLTQVLSKDSPSKQLIHLTIHGLKLSRLLEIPILLGWVQVMPYPLPLA